MDLSLVNSKLRWRSGTGVAGWQVAPYGELMLRSGAAAEIVDLLLAKLRYTAAEITAVLLAKLHCTVAGIVALLRSSDYRSARRNERNAL